MSITSDLIRGHIDTIILRQLLIEDNYGYNINKSVKIMSEGDYELKEATLYSAFRRLEDGNLINSYWGDQNTGARRKYYTITALGKQTYEQNIKEWNSAKILIDTLILREDHYE